MYVYCIYSALSKSPKQLQNCLKIAETIIVLIVCAYTVTVYQISLINMYKDQLSRQTGSRNLTGPKTLPTIWYTYMMLVTKYQISAINSYWEKCDKNILDGRTDRGKTVYPSPPSGSGGIISVALYNLFIFTQTLIFFVMLLELSLLDIYALTLRNMMTFPA